MSDRPTSFHDFKWACGHTGPGYCKVCRDEQVEAKDAEIERLRTFKHANYMALQEAQRQIVKLRAVVDAVKDIKWRSIEKDNMEFATTCFVVDRIRKALAALEEADDE